MKIKKGSYLFICKANENRSIYAQKWLARKAEEQGIKIRVMSAGLDAAKLNNGGTQLTGEHLDSADYTFVMEGDMRIRLNMYGNGGGRVFVLSIPDIFQDGFEDPASCNDMTYEQAREYVMQNRGNGRNFRIGTVLFEKLLEGELEKVLSE